VDEALIAKVLERVSNDFDVAGALAVIFEWINTKPTEVRGTLDRLNELLNIFPVDFIVTEEEQALIEERKIARAEKNWSRSDEIREQLSHLELEDAASETFVKPKI
jgi:cysteinyl-tRNA synthetase